MHLTRTRVCLQTPAGYIAACPTPELHLQTALAPALIATKGYAASGSGAHPTPAPRSYVTERGDTGAFLSPKGPVGMQQGRG